MLDILEEELMTYDKTTHRFTLTVKGCSDIDDVTKRYNGEREAMRTLNSISRTIYNYIYSNNAVGNKPYVEFLLAKDDELITMLYEAMKEQLEADISSGYNDVKNQVGINFKTNTLIQENTLRTRIVAPNVKNILEQYSDKIMTARFLARRYDPMPKDRYERYDY